MGARSQSLGLPNSPDDELVHRAIYQSLQRSIARIPSDGIGIEAASPTINICIFLKNYRKTIYISRLTGQTDANVNVNLDRLKSQR